MRLLVVTEEQRYGPRWLRDNDDDESLMNYLVVSLLHYPFACCRLDRATVDAELDEVVLAMIENYFEPEKNGLIARKM